MERLFDVDQVEKWANFSGDYNPIHFDPEAAAGIGQEGVVAHGMLVLMSAKQALTDHAEKEDGWVRAQSWFRRPVSQSRPVTVGIEKRDQKLRFAVGDQTNEALIEGTFAPATCAGTCLDRCSAEPEFGASFDRTELAERWEYFEGSFPSITASWIFIDALIFSAFIEKHVDALLKSTAGEGTLHHVVQTSQQVNFDASTLSSLSYGRNVDLAYSYRQAEWMHDASRIAGNIHLSALLNGETVLTSKVGLLAVQDTSSTAGSKPRLNGLHLAKEDTVQ